MSRIVLAPLAWLGRQGTRAVAAVVLIGVAAPPIGAVLKPFVTPAIVGLLLIAFLRVDAKLLRIHLRRPALVLTATAWTALVIPFVCGVAGLALGLDVSAPELFVSLMLQAVAPPMMAAPAFAALMGLDATLVLATLVTSAALNPLTAPLLAYAFAGPALALSPVTLGLKLGAILAGSAAAAAVIRRAVGEDAIMRHKDQIDGVNIIAMFVFVDAVMENLAADLIAEPMRVVGMAALAFLLCFAVLGVTIAAFAPWGRARAFALGFMASQRNLGLMLAATGGMLPDVTWLWFALSQFPIYLAPQMFKPVVRLLLPEAKSVGSTR
jgi:predicted Na+-dependent transporter